MISDRKTFSTNPAIIRMLALFSERQPSLLFLGQGLAALLAGIYLLRRYKPPKKQIPHMS